MSFVSPYFAKMGKTSTEIFPQSRRGANKSAVPFWGMAKLANQIRELRRDRGWTLEHLSERSKISVSTLQRLEVGDRRINSEHLDSLAQAFRCAPADILSVPTNRAIQILGIVGLGEEIEWQGEGDMDLGEVEVAGISATDGLMALECRGDSMRPRVNDRELVIARRRDGKRPADLLGREAIVKLRSGPVLLKRIRRGYEPGRFNLESYNADLRENVEIDWVAELVSIIPEGAWRRVE